MEDIHDHLKIPEDLNKLPTEDPTFILVIFCPENTQGIPTDSEPS